MSLEQVKLAFYYGSWLAIPAAVVAAALIAKTSGGARMFAAAALFLIGLFAYARFVEPRILLAVKHETTLERCFAESGQVTIAAFSDLHIGLFPNTTPVGRIVRRVNKIGPDLVFIAGDFTSNLVPDEIPAAFAPLAYLKAPVYAVTGNHDTGRPGRDVKAPLTKALEDIGVNMIDNAMVRTRIDGAEIEIVGISDLMAGGQKLSLFDGVDPIPRLVLTHNPSTVGRIGRPKQNVDLMIAGHTHAGQINIPLITCRLTEACQTRRYGFKEAPKGRVFVTSGVGMTALPLRFNAAPRIDVLEVSWRACPGT